MLENSENNIHRLSDIMPESSSSKEDHNDSYIPLNLNDKCIVHEIKCQININNNN